MLGPHLISTVNQKVLSLLVKFADREFYEWELSRRLGISAGGETQDDDSGHGLLHRHQITKGEAPEGKRRVLQNAKAAL